MQSETSFWCWPRSKSHHLSAELLLLRPPFHFIYTYLCGSFAILASRIWTLSQTDSELNCKVHTKCRYPNIEYIFRMKSLNAFGSNCKLNAQYFRLLTRTHHEKVVLQIQLINTLFSWDDWRNCRLGKLFFCNYLWLLLLLIPFHRYICSFNDICTSDVVLLFFVASLFTRFVLCGCLTIKGKFKTIKTVYTLYNAIGAKRRLYNNIVCAWY